MSRVGALEEALRGLLEALELQDQPLHLSGQVDSESPGGQMTAILPWGEPVDRRKFLRQARERARQLLNEGVR